MKKKGTPLRVMTIYVVRQLQLAVGSAIEFYGQLLCLWGRMGSVGFVTNQTTKFASGTVICYSLERSSKLARDLGCSQQINSNQLLMVYYKSGYHSREAMGRRAQFEKPKTASSVGLHSSLPHGHHG
jgi:hypothetical protein